MNYVYSILLGYVIGNINPAYIIAKIKGFDIREHGSKNPGASNALILMGKIVGLFCAVFDIAKAVFAVWMCQKLFATIPYIFSLTSVACIAGHMFPFYMRGRGGKGLACLGGVILVYDWRVFAVMMTGELLLALLTNYICVVPLTASVIFPVVYGVLEKSLWGALILCVATVLIWYKHMENLKRIKAGEEVRLCFLWNREKELQRLGKQDVQP